MTPTFLFALLLYGPIAGIIEATPPQRWHEIGDHPGCLRPGDCARRRHALAIPRRFALGVREMFALQPRLEHPRGRRALRVLEHPRFRAAYDLLLLRAQFGLAPREMADWWTRLQEASVPRSAAAWLMRSPVNARGRERRRAAARRRRRRRPAARSAA